MGKKISLFVTYPPYMKTHEEYRIEISPEKAIDLIKKKYCGWVVVVEYQSGKFVTSDLNKILNAKSVYIYYPIGGG